MRQALMSSTRKGGFPVTRRNRLLLLSAAMVTLLWLLGCGGVGEPATTEPADATPEASPTEVPEATVAASPGRVRTGRFGPVVFSSDFDDAAGEPVDVGLTFDQGIVRLYAYWPYENMEPGERFRWDFYHDDAHFYGQYGTFEYESGSQWQWIYEADGGPLEPGTYELVVKVGDQVVLQDACEVREAPTPTVTQAPTPTHTAAPVPTNTPAPPPLPTPTSSPTRQAGPTVGWVEVLNYCGSDMTFTIAGQMYTVGANSSYRIELSPAEYTYTASLGLGRYADVNGSVTVQAGVVSQLSFSADV
jgi:hypothetical protein